MAKGATIDVPMHWAYLMGIWCNVPLSHDFKKMAKEATVDVPMPMVIGGAGGAVGDFFWSDIDLVDCVR